MELWKDIPNYEGLYQASNMGNIRTHENKTTSSARYSERHWKQRIMKQKWQVRSDGRTDARVELWKDGKHKTLLVARLVAMTWVDGFAEELTVNHKDGNPRNNNADNLEWVSRKENIQHGFKTGLYSSRFIPISLVDENGNKFDFDTLSSASKWLNRNSKYLYNALKRNTKITSATGTVYFVD